MLLDLTHQKLRWPARSSVLTPAGAGPSVFAELAQRKLGDVLSRMEGVRVEAGILAGNPQDSATEAPIAIVCEFPNKVSPDTLREAHRLAWNFCRSPLLVTLEPTLVRAWTCCERPAQPGLFGALAGEITEARMDLEAVQSASAQAAQALHWVTLASGRFIREHENRFRREHAADKTLLGNLHYVREKLKFPHDVGHDLLARLIFIQFLFDRKDSAGKAALNAGQLRRLFEQKVLSARYTDFASILENYDDSYRLFRWLNRKFNGDLFPGKGETAAEQEAEWKAEMNRVKPQHLKLLARFVSGREEMKGGQLGLWPDYSFDAIPLEFISSIYEEFVAKGGTASGTHYTPGHVVDAVLDAVLPWDGDEWDLKVLDPACGSGIFLVKAYQRLIHRWKKAHPGQEITASTLRRLLERNLFGVDIDPHAVRVASFSLYLAMCDQIDPRHYWRSVTFPPLRGSRIRRGDFFDFSAPASLPNGHSGFDLAVGNAPWGRKTGTPAAREWAKRNGWALTYDQIGPLFLPAAAALTEPSGTVSMLQPSGPFLFHQVGTARKFRRKLFSELEITEIINLSALRFNLFPKAVSPACIVTLRPRAATGRQITYVCPKPLANAEDGYRIVVEPHQVNLVDPEEAFGDPLVWSALMWGGPRDLALVRRLSRRSNLIRLKKSRVVTVREGIIRGDRGKRESGIVGRPLLEADRFPNGTFLHLKAKDLPENRDPCTDSKASTDFAAFELPQLLIKQAWQIQHGRFQAAVVEAGSKKRGVICDQKYLSVHSSEEKRSLLEGAALVYNSTLAVYFMLLTSGRLAFYRPEPLVRELLAVPLPEPREGILAGLGDWPAVDRRVREAFEFKEAEWALIDDLVRYTLPDFKGDESSPGRQPTRRLGEKGCMEPDLGEYCDYILKVLRAGFGADKRLAATIFREASGPLLPVRIVAIDLDHPDRSGVAVETMEPGALLERLQALDNLLQECDHGTILYRRVARVYDTRSRGRQRLPTVYVIKPDRVHYWLKSMALRDGDEVAGDIVLGPQPTGRR